MFLANDVLRDAQYIFDCIEHSYIYIPKNKDDYVSNVESQLRLLGKPVPKEFSSSCIQYSVSCQLHHMFNLLGCDNKREVLYSEKSKHRADIKVNRQIDGEYFGVQKYTIWLEIDASNVNKIYRVLWEKLSLLQADSNKTEEIYYAIYVYSNSSYSEARITLTVKSIIEAIMRNISTHTINVSFIVMYYSEDFYEEVDCDLNIEIKGNDIIILPSNHFFYGKSKHTEYYLLNLDKEDWAKALEIIDEQN